MLAAAAAAGDAAVSKVCGNCRGMSGAKVLARGSMSPHDYEQLLKPTHAHTWMHVSARTQAPHAYMYAHMRQFMEALIHVCDKTDRQTDTCRRRQTDRH